VELFSVALDIAGVLGDRPSGVANGSCVPLASSLAFALHAEASFRAAKKMEGVEALGGQAQRT
jgi:hypothetical protein